MEELKPCPVCGKIPELQIHLLDIPEATELYPKASLRCDCRKAYSVVATTETEAVEFITELWNRRTDNGICKENEAKE